MWSFCFITSSALDSAFVFDTKICFRTYIFQGALGVFLTSNYISIWNLGTKNKNETKKKKNTSSTVCPSWTHSSATNSKCESLIDPDGCHRRIYGSHLIPCNRKELRFVTICRNKLPPTWRESLGADGRCHCHCALYRYIICRWDANLDAWDACLMLLNAWEFTIRCIDRFAQ